MRLSSFQARGSKIFPTACEELNRRRDVLETEEKRLEADADALREELGEDKWVHSFRQAGSKALAMWNSLTKSIQKLRQAIEEGDDEKLASRISTYKDKREHYPPSMRRVLELIDIEMKNRSTVNGEILRIQQDVRQKVTELEADIREMDAILEDFNSNRKLRDSVSTVFSARTEHSMSSSAIDTPSSSPASSVILMSRKSSDHGPSTPNAGSKSRQGSFASSRSSVPTSRRYSSVPSSASGVSHIPRKSLGSRLDSLPFSSPSRASSNTPRSSVRSTTPRSDRSETKPRWNASTNLNDTVIGHNFKPLSATTPSPHRKLTPPRTLRSVSSHSAIPVPSPLSRTSENSPPAASALVRPSSTTPSQQPPASKRLSLVHSPSTPLRHAGSNIATVGGSNRRLSTMVEPARSEDTVEESPTSKPKPARPSSVMNSRRSSLLPQPKGRTYSGTGRDSRMGGGRESRPGGRNVSMSGIMTSEEKPRWRG